jgi:hypothetical protein
VGGVDDIDRQSAFGDASVVGAVGVVDVDVFGEVLAEAAEGVRSDVYGSGPSEPGLARGPGPVECHGVVTAVNGGHDFDRHADEQWSLKRRRTTSESG